MCMSEKKFRSDASVSKKEKESAGLHVKAEQEMNTRQRAYNTHHKAYSTTHAYIYTHVHIHTRTPVLTPPFVSSTHTHSPAENTLLPHSLCTPRKSFTVNVLRV